jgi:hypothetical protein
MTQSLRAKLAGRVGGMILLLTLGIPTALAQQNPPLSQETVLTFVHDFLQVFYADLISKGHMLKLSVHHPADSSWREIAGVYFTVNPERPSDYGLVRFGPNGPILETRPDPESVLLDGSIWLPPLKNGSRILQVRAITMGEKKLDALRKLVQSHPEWSDEQAVGALMQDGARFGPEEKKAFISTLPLDKMERFLGHLKITSVDFRYPPQGRDEHTSVLVSLCWDVTAEALFSDGTSAKYFFSFEPYEGRLTYLWRELD